MIRRRYLKAAVSIEEYREICARADTEGLTMAGYIRAAVARDVERQNVAQTMAEIRAALPNDPAAPPENHEPAFEELLQLARLLATHTDPQAAARITSAINQKYPERKIK